MKNDKLWKSYLYACIACLILTALDQFTKHLAVIHLMNQPSLVLIPGVFELQYLENRGAAFGMFQDKQIIFLVGAAFVFLVIAYFYAKIPHQKRYYLMRSYAVLIISGAAGNMIDRVRLKYVVDFFYFSLIDFPVFNIADCYVVIGCILFAFSLLFYYTEEELAIFSFKKSS